MSKVKEKEAFGTYLLSISVVTYVGVVLESFTGEKINFVNLSVGFIVALVFLRIGLNLIRNSGNIKVEKINKRGK